MPATTPIDVRSCASSVMSALSDLQGYLSAAVNPDRIALADLEMEPMGWTKKAYSKKAFETWQAQHRSMPDDPLHLHHLAIMHHARAFDLELGAKPTEADEDWAAAMGYWQRLHEMDAFWVGLTAKACTGGTRQESIKKLRAELPQMLLAIHYDIAFDKETREKRKSRSKFHIGLAHKAPFDAGVRAEAQKAAYSRYIKAIRDEVWQPSELREEIIEEGERAIEEYLDYDPGCLPALEDALRLQRRLQKSRITRYRSLSEGDSERESILRRAKKDAESKCRFFDQITAVGTDLDETTREDLAQWYDLCAQVLSMLDEREKAVGFYERAAGLYFPDKPEHQDEYKKRIRDVVQTMAVVARAKAGNEDAGARAYCDRIHARNDLTMIACYVLAGAYSHLSEYDIALELCNRGLQIEPDLDELDEAEEWVKRLTDFKAEIPINQAVSLGSAAMKNDRHEDAWMHLTEAEEAALAAGTIKNHHSIYFLRAQAFLAQNQTTEARKDIESFSRLVDKASPAEVKALERLQQMVEQAEQVFREFGGPEAAQLRQKAIQAFNADHQDEAIGLLRQAIKASMQHGHTTGAPKLKTELSMILTSRAIAIVNKAQEGH